MADRSYTLNDLIQDLQEIAEEKGDKQVILEIDDRHRLLKGPLFTKIETEDHAGFLFLRF